MLTEVEERELAELLEVQYGGEQLEDFILRMTEMAGKRLAPPRHIKDLLIPHLEAAGRTPKRLVICMPPRHAKSHTVMHAIGWHLSRNPHLVNAYVSYNEKQTAKFSRKIRRIVERAGVKLDSQRLDYWTTRQGGGMNASSSLTGEGITGWLVIDDPFKEREDAESPTMRENVWDWFTDVAYTRLQKGASCIAIQTRWHQEDLAGRLLKGGLGEEWELVEMPAIRDEATGEPNDDGIALWPQEFPLERLHAIRLTMGPYGWWSLYQQRPRPHGSQLFGAYPALYDLPEVMGARGAIICDPAATAKTSSDYTAIGVFSMVGTGVGCRMFVLEIVRMQAPMTKVIDELARLQKKWRYPIGFEGVGGFKMVPDMMRSMHPGIDVFDITPMGDKVTRAQPCAAGWADQRVLLPKAEAPWVRPYVEEMRAFTGLGDVHDDQVDVTAHGWNVLYRDSKIVRPGAVDGGW